MIGRRFGSLVVVEKLRKHPTAKKDFIYHCRCDCGGTCEARRKSLQKGHKKSCGCLAEIHQSSHWVGKKVGQLLVLSRLPSKKYLCRCDCGSEVVSTSMWSRAKSSASGIDVHCGGAAHRQKKERPAHAAKPKKREHPRYGVWAVMKQRCYNPNNPDYHRYGGRGITVCDAWREDFWAYAQYVDSLGARPDGYSLDRIDNNGNYEPNNLRWASAQMQVDNRTLAVP